MVAYNIEYDTFGTITRIKGVIVLFLTLEPPKKCCIEKNTIFFLIRNIITNMLHCYKTIIKELQYAICCKDLQNNK